MGVQEIFDHFSAPIWDLRGNGSEEVLCASNGRIGEWWGGDEQMSM